MNKKLIILGIGIGLICSVAGASLYLFLFTEFNLFSDFEIITSEKILGKIIALGSVLNLIVFLALIKYNKELIARGVVLSTLFTAIITLFI